MPNILTYHTYHPYNTNQSCHTYHAYHTYQTYHTFQTCHTRPTIHIIHTQHTIPHPHHTTGGKGGVAGPGAYIYIYIRYIRTSSWDRLPTFPKGMDRSRRLTTSLNCIWNGQVVLSPLGVGVGGLLLSQQQHHKTKKWLHPNCRGDY